MILTYNDIIKASNDLSKQLPDNKYKFICGVSTGGVLAAYIIAKIIGAELISESQIKNHDELLVIADLIDSDGSELKLFSEHGIDTATLYRLTSKKGKDKNIFHSTHCVNLLDNEDVIYLPY